MNSKFAKYLPKKVSPVYIALGTCCVLFVFSNMRLATWEREARPLLTELGGSSDYGFRDFRRDYMVDPYGKATTMSQRQLQIGSELTGMLPGYESALGSRRTFFLGTLVCLLILAYQRWGSNLRTKFRQQFAKVKQEAMKEAMRRAAAKAGQSFNQPPPSSSGGSTSVKGAVVNNIVSCPACRKEMRVPAGKGRIRVTCAACGNKFETLT